VARWAKLAPRTRALTSSDRAMLMTSASGARYPAGVATPVLLTQHALEHLAARIAGQRLDEVHRARPLEAGEAAPAELDDLRLGASSPGAQDDDRLDRLAPRRVRPTAHRPLRPG